jgi:uncharacterized protein
MDPITGQQIFLLLTPWLLLGSTYFVFQAFKRRIGAHKSYLAGFLFYWIVWCLLIPLILIGPENLLALFRPAAPPFGRPAWLGAFCLIGPPLVSFATIFPRAVRKTSLTLVLVTAFFAVINGTAEEILWRGAYAALFPHNFWIGQLYASLGFGLWHLAPQSIFPSQGRGGRLALAASAGFLGILWAWVANTTGIILFTVFSHILIDFSALQGGLFTGRDTEAQP